LGRGRGLVPAPAAVMSPTFVLLTAFRGLGVGVLTGLVGVGGGFLIVPSLVSGGLPMSSAIGTSLMVIAMNCATGLYGHAGYVRIAWPPVLLVTAAAIPGIAAGTYLMRWTSPATLRRSFAALLVTVAAYTLYQVLTAHTA
jgi:uncharacterized membrane protein YfcA